MEYEDDAHFCLKCHSTILGLDNYVNHRKAGCSKNVEDPSKSPLPSQLLPPDEIDLKADDFFSSLELRSSSKKPVQSTSGKNFSGILTRSKITAIQATTPTNKEQPEAQQSKSGKNVWIGGNPLKDLGTGDNQSKLIKAVANLERRKDGTTAPSSPRIGTVYEDSDEESEDYDYDEDETSEEEYALPRNHTGGKWKPSSPIHWGNNREWNTPPPTYTGGKWKPQSASYTKGKLKPSEDDGPSTSTSGKYPPPGHTRGKWKPRIETDDDRFPPPTHTKGKWKPKMEHEDDSFPPPTHTRGKWKPKCEEEPPVTFLAAKGKAKPKSEITSGTTKTTTEEQPLTKPKLTGKRKTKLLPKVARLKSKSSKASKTAKFQETAKRPIKKTPIISKELPKVDVKITDDTPLRQESGNYQYWCTTCNRKLASKVVYERHLKSELHFKRTRPDGEFDDGAVVKKTKFTEPNTVAVSTIAKLEPPAQLVRLDEKKRNRRKIFEICTVCRSKVKRHLMGKHLISHYHCRKGDITTEASKKLVLANIQSIVLESPFECSVCKFYCNTHDQFVDHWKSTFHRTNDRNRQGYYLCAFCKQRTESSDDMFAHLTSPEHLEVVSVINRSVAITIKKISEKSCQSCQKKFSLNIQLLQHCKKLDHDASNVSLCKKEDYECDECEKTFSKAISLQRHLRKKHAHEFSFCGVCNVRFQTSVAAKKHRMTSEHRYAMLALKTPDKGSSLKRRCEHCQKYFNNFLLLKEHLKAEHPDHKVKCPYCGAKFTVAQELSNHIKNKSCKFPDATDAVPNPEHPYRCEKCPYSSDSMAELLFHVALHNEPLILSEEGNSKAPPQPRYKCSLCDKFFPKPSLLPHLRLHTEERPFVCKICNTSFTRKNNLLFHEKNHVKKQTFARKVSKEDKEFLCSTCGAGFNRKFTLQQHMLTHGGKLCRCPEVGCFYTARKMSELQEHFRTHSDEKNFGCDLCEYRGKTKQQLKRHMTIHDGTKRYSCNVCSLTFRTAAHLKRHVRLHTGAKPFKCPYCDYKCNNMENLRRHVLSTTRHPGKCIYECKFCNSGDKFRTNVAKEFRNHLILNHEAELGNGKDATTYVAGIYEAHEDNTCTIDDVDNDLEEGVERVATKHASAEEDLSKLNTNDDPVVAQLIQPVELGGKEQPFDQMLPMFIIPKEDGECTEIAPDAWNLIGRYDVEESGTLVPFQSGDEDELFQEHF